MRRSAYALLLLLVMMPALAYGQTITAAWDPNPPEDQITGYQVCIGRASLSCDVQLATVPASETSYAFTLSPGVLYWFAVRATSPAGNSAYSTEVAASVPSLEQPPNQISTVNTPINPLSLTVSDPDASALQFGHNGLPFGLTLNTNTGVITGTPTSTGTFNVTVFVSDNLETISRTFVWTVQSTGSSDATAPSLAITSHTSGQTVTTSTITLAGTASDGGAGGSGITSVTVNGSTATGGSASGNNTANWSRSVSLALGANTFTVVAADGAGNVRTSSVTITRGTSTDATAPTLTITSHLSGQTVGTSIITVAGTATDNGAGGSGIASVTVNGGAASGGTASGTGTANWSRSVTLVTGGNLVTVVATDGAGNARTTSLTLFLSSSSTDTTQPSLSITSHTSGQTLTSNTITLAGTATDSGSGGSGISSVTVNGSSASGGTASGNNTASWSRALTLPAGANVITVIATDGAGNVRSIPITLTAPAASPSSASISANRTSPQTAGTAVTLSATASGGASPYSYKWWAQMNGGSWSLLQDWGGSTLNWTPSVAGSYTVGLWVRSSGVSADAPQTTAALTFLVTAASAPAAPPPSSGSMTGVSLSVNRVSPQAPGTTVTLTANGSGGSSPYSYKWWAQMNGGVWTLLQDWSTSTNLAWTPSQSGNYLLAAWGRSAGATADTPQTVGSITFAISGSSSTPPPSSSSPMTGVSLGANLISPQAPGTTVTLTANGSGGSTPYSYKWWAQLNGGAWTLLQEWSTSTNLAWTPSQGGNYVLAAWARSAGATADTPQTIGSLSFVINGSTSTPPPPAPSSPPPSSSGPMTSASVTADSSTVMLGRSLRLTTSGNGGTGPYSFKVWVQKDGGAWTLVRDWSTNTTLDWIANAPGKYMFGVWGRSAGATADAPQSVGVAIVTAIP